MNDSGLRLLHIFKLMPRYPQSISAKEMIEKLANLDSEFGGITEKQIKRNFSALQSFSPYIVTTKEIDGAPKTRENRYCWHPDSPNISLERIDPSTAAMLLLGYEQLNALIANDIKLDIQPFIDEAKTVLKDNNISERSWNKKVRIMHSTPLHTAAMKPQAFSVIYDSLLKDKQFTASYNGHDQATFNPLGLVQRNHALYLICTYDKATKPYILALHRFDAAERTKKKSTKPPNFNLDDYIASGELDWKWSKEQDIKLQIEVSPWLRGIINETPLDKKQKIEAIEGSNNYLVTADVIDNHELRSWILGLTTDVKVVRPKALQSWVIESLQVNLDLYRS